MSYRVRINLNVNRSQKPWRLGTAQFIPREGQCWEVLWDGLKGVQRFHKDYIEIVGEGGDSSLYLMEGWRNPEEFVRDVYEAITVNCNDANTREKTLTLLREKLQGVSP